MIKTKAALPGGPASIQPTRTIEKYLKSSDWLEKSGYPKKATNGPIMQTGYYL